MNVTQYIPKQRNLILLVEFRINKQNTTQQSSLPRVLLALNFLCKYRPLYTTQRLKCRTLHISLHATRHPLGVYYAATATSTTNAMFHFFPRSLHLPSTPTYPPHRCSKAKSNSSLYIGPVRCLWTGLPTTRHATHTSMQQLDIRHHRSGPLTSVTEDPPVIPPPPSRVSHLLTSVIPFSVLHSPQDY